jgi:hypothetical protein
MPPKESAAIWNPFTAKSRAEQSASEMYPGKIGQDDQRDAARHMLASGYLAKAWGPGIADLIGKAYEFKETPFRHLGALAGMANYRYDRPIDLHNNATGIELAQKAGDMEEFERLVNLAAERARPTQTPGAPWVPTPKDAAAMRKTSQQYAAGGPVTADHTQPDMADGGALIADPNLYAGGGIVKGAIAAARKAAESAGMKAPTLANKELTTLQDTHTMLGDRIRAEAELARKMMEEFDYKYDKGHRVFTQDSATKNRVPYEVLERTRTGNQIMYDTSGGGMKARKDPETGKAMRTPYEPGYRVRSQQGDDTMEFVIPQSAIRGDVEMAKGGLAAGFADGGAAIGHFPQMKPHRAGKSDIGERMTEEALKFFIPQDTTDLALMALPFGKAGKAAAAGLMALSPGEAEAGKLKTGVDLARRSLFGLKPSQDMAGRELVRKAEPTLDEMRAALNRAEKAAPKVEERTVSIDPGKGSAKVVDTLQKVAETPVSRRTVLKSATSQAVQHALPAHSFADLMRAPAAAEPGVVDIAREFMKAPYENLPTFESAVPMGAILGKAIRPSAAKDLSIYELRPELRTLRKASPEDYEGLKSVIRDVSEYGFEP